MSITWTKILMYLIFLILVSLNYYIFTLLTSKFVISEKRMFVPNILEGLVNGGITVGVTILFYYWLNIHNFYIIFALSIFIIVRTWPVYIASLVFPLVGHWVIYGNFQVPYIIHITIVISTLFLISLLNKLFFKKLHTSYWIIPVNLFALILSLTLLWTVFGGSISLESAMDYIGPFIFLVFIFLFYFFILSFWKSANSLIDVNIYDYNNFYRIKTSEDALGSFLKNNKIDTGIFLIISLKTENDIQMNQDREFILNKLETYFNRFNALYFKISKDEYGLFFSILKLSNIKKSIQGNSLLKRDPSDFLFDVEETICKFNSSVGTKYPFGAVVYGVQEFAFYNAFDKARFSLNSSKITSKNILTLFNPSYYNKYHSDLLSMRNLNKEILISHISSEFFTGIRTNGNIANYYFSLPYLTSHSLNITINQILDYSKQVGMESILTRYLAAETVRNFGSITSVNQSKLIVKYSTTILSDPNFSPDVFLNIIRFYKVPIKNIVLIFKFESMKKNRHSKLFRKNLKFLSEQQIKIGVYNLGHSKSEWKLLKVFDLGYLCLDNSFYKQEFKRSILKDVIDFSKETQSKIMAYQISNKKHLNNIINNNIDILFGDYIQKATPFPIRINREQKKQIKERINDAK